jgi:hypothetical protein
MNAELKELVASNALRQRLWFTQLDTISVGITPARFTDALALTSGIELAEIVQFAEIIQVRRLLYDEFHTPRPA